MSFFSPRDREVVDQRTYFIPFALATQEVLLEKALMDVKRNNPLPLTVEQEMSVRQIIGTTVLAVDEFIYGKGWFGDIQDMQQQLLKAKQENDKLAEDIEEQDKVMEDRYKRMMEIVIERDAAERTCTDLKEENNKLTKRCADLDTHIDALYRSINEKDMVISQVLRKNSNLLLEVQTMLREGVALDTQMDEIKQRAEKMARQHKQMQELVATLRAVFAHIDDEQ